MHKLIGMTTALLILPIAAPVGAEVVHSDRQISDRYVITDEFGRTCGYQSVIDTYVETLTGDIYTVQEAVNLGCTDDAPVLIDPNGLVDPYDSGYGEPIPVEPIYDDPLPVDPYGVPVPYDPSYGELIPTPEFW
jgi:hypothetical protein